MLLPHWFKIETDILTIVFSYDFDKLMRSVRNTLKWNYEDRFELLKEKVSETSIYRIIL